MFQPRLPRLLCQMLFLAFALWTRPSPESREPCQGQSPWMIFVVGRRAISEVEMGFGSGVPESALD